MIEAGVNVFRLNFSHGTLDGHARSLERIRRAAATRQATVAVMGDLCGPKIRVDPIVGGKIELSTDQPIIFQRAAINGTRERLSSNYPSLVDDVHVGHRLLIDDGNVQLRVIEKHTDELHCRCEVGGEVSTRKGINLPDSNISAPSMTDKDRADLQWAIANDLDFVALSFVRDPADLRQLREIIQRHGSPIRIVSKIERPEAVDQLDAIIDASDVVLVARGDLGVEMDVSRVPMIQKEIALLSRRAGKPVIVATQMLQSMVDAPVPTRAEVSDVANAILDQADAVMLSAETSVGHYALEAVRMIGRVAEQTEAFGTRYRDELQVGPSEALRTVSAVVRGVSLIAEELKTQLVAVWTESGDTARLLSKHRITQPIIGVSADERVCRQMAMSYGVIPIQLKTEPSVSAMLTELDRVLLERGLAERGDSIIVTADARPDLPGETDMLLVHPVGTGKDMPSPGRGERN